MSFWVAGPLFLTNAWYQMAELAQHNSYDLTDVRVEQAQLLKKRALGSSLFVEFIVCNIAFILLVTGSHTHALIWFVAATGMVCVTYLYARLVARDGVNRSNVAEYLRGHIAVSSLTGLVWSGFAIYQVDWGSELNLAVSSLLVCGITMGGILPSSAYRPGYVGLAIFTLLPFGFFTLLFAPWPINLLGLFILVYFAFCMIISTRAELGTRDAIAARNERDLTATVISQNAEIQRTHDEKTRFLAATSHDLSQPLHAQGYLIRALREKLTTPAQAELLDKIELTWRRQGQFLKGLVDINQLDNGVIVPKNKRVDLQVEIQSLLQEFADVAAVKQIVLKHSLEPARCVTDLVLLNRMLRNILSNAVKYTQAGGTVEISLKQSFDTVEITIRDNGPGIPEKEYERIFDEYVQLEGAEHSAQEGTGLGLSIVRRIASLLGVSLKLQSKVGEGAAFTLSLPLNKDCDFSAETSATPIGTLAMPFGAAPFIVIVDDEPAILEAMSVLLTNWGCQLITAATPHEALSLLGATNQTPSLLIVDKQLSGGENGIDLIRTLREEMNEDIPAVLMSGDLKSLAGEAGLPGVQLLKKPVEPDEIQKIISDIIGQQNKPLDQT